MFIDENFCPNYNIHNKLFRCSSHHNKKKFILMNIRYCEDLAARVVMEQNL